MDLSESNNCEYIYIYIYKHNSLIIISFSIPLYLLTSVIHTINGLPLCKCQVCKLTCWLINIQNKMCPVYVILSFQLIILFHAIYFKIQ